MQRPSDYVRRVDAALSLVALGFAIVGVFMGVAIAHVAGWGCSP